MKRLAYIFGFLIALLLTGIISAALPGVMEGFSGIVIWTFLGYCALIVVAQLFSAMFAVRKMVESLFDEYYERKKASRRVSLR